LKNGPAPGHRAAKYDVASLRQEISKLRNQLCEIGLHGLDAWRDEDLARQEQARIEDVAGAPGRGVRMHWLYFDQGSFDVLDKAGFSYDSTFGYNGAIGFKAGTAKPFRPTTATTLIELPLIIQDTAMFYPDRMDLTEKTAMDKCRHVLRRLSEYGGVLTVNWHTRSLSPERLWGDFYKELIAEVKAAGGYFATAEQAVTWFRARRDLRIESVDRSSGAVRVTLSGTLTNTQLPFSIRDYNPTTSKGEAPVFTQIGATELEDGALQSIRAT
jgi:hypothetical protein